MLEPSTLQEDLIILSSPLTLRVDVHTGSQAVTPQWRQIAPNFEREFSILNDGDGVQRLFPQVVSYRDHQQLVRMSTSNSAVPSRKLPDVERNDEGSVSVGELPAGALPVPLKDQHHGLHRGLSARQVSMIAIAGTIGTGLFLGTGRSLAQGGPASMLICYALVGFIVYITLLLLGEMATQYPVAGEYRFNTCYIILL